MLLFRWLRDNPRVAAIDKEPATAFKLGKKEFFLRSPFQTYWPNGPSIEAIKYHDFMHHDLYYFECKSCNVGVWGWGQQIYCGSWKCFKVIFGDKK